MLLSKKQYKQKWFQFRSKHRSATKNEIWTFQKSLLSEIEIELAENQNLVLDQNDPRSWVMDESDRAYDDAPDE